MGSTVLAESSDLWAAGTTIGTLALAAATVWLGFKTKRAVEEGRRQEAEAIRARLDARAPRVTVLVSEAFSSAYRGPKFVGDSLPRLAQGEFTIPGQELEGVGLGAELLILNDGDHIAVIEFEGEPVWRTERVSFPALTSSLVQAAGPLMLADGRCGVPPHVRVWLDLVIVRPVRDWTAGIESSTIAVVVRDALDDGLVDRWPIVLAGSPVRLDPDDAGHVVPDSTARSVSAGVPTRAYPSLDPKP